MSDRRLTDDELRHAEANAGLLREVAKVPCEVVLCGDHVEVTIWTVDTIITRAYSIR